MGLGLVILQQKLANVETVLRVRFVKRLVKSIKDMAGSALTDANAGPMRFVIT